MREIITLQLGSIANHVGTHFWNAQVIAQSISSPFGIANRQPKYLCLLGGVFLEIN